MPATRVRCMPAAAVGHSVFILFFCCLANRSVFVLNCIISSCVFERSSECPAACSLRCLYLRGDARNSILCVSNACAVVQRLQQQLGTLHFLLRGQSKCLCVELLFLLVFSSSTVQECGDNPSLSSAHSSCCHRCPRTGVCSLHVVHTVLHGVELVCAVHALNIASFFCNVRRCSRVHILVLECALSACWSRLIPLVQLL